jgi:Na+/H+-dicarboxylate symporter
MGRRGSAGTVVSAPAARGASTWPALIALGVGLAGGALLHAIDAPLALRAATIVEPIGTIWTNALRMIVVPLVVANLVMAMVGNPNVRGVGRLTGLSVALFLLLLALAAGFTLLTAPLLLRWFTIAPSAVSALARTHDAAAAGPAEAFDPVRWLVGLVPINPFRAATGDDILPVLIFTAATGLALRRVAEEVRRPLIAVVSALSEAMFVLLHALLAVMPVGIVALTFVLAARTGAASVGAIGFFVAYEIALLIACTLGLYPIAAAGGRVGIRRFAWGALPGQMVAVSTRSSIAALPGMLEGAEQRLGLSREVSSLVLPLSVSTFKINRAISSTAQLLFLAKLYGVHLEPHQILTFVATIGLTSFSTPGVPSSGSHASLPAYVAAGIPIEGVMILGAVDTLPDIFKTLINVTADMAVAVIVGRFARPKA